MNAKKIDCALIFAIEEEFNIVKENQEIELIGQNYFMFKFIDRDGISRDCITTYVSEPGSHEAYKFLTNFRKEYAPHICFIIGISGQIDDDLKIGDICISSTILKYDYNLKLKDGQYKFSGRSIATPFHEEWLKRLPNLAAGNYSRWQKLTENHFNSNFTKPQQEELINKGFIRKDFQSSYRYGNIATGEVVVDDKVMKQAIQDKDRKLLCVDMESYGFADAVNGENLIVIRVISDTADGRKKELDNFGNNTDALRKWALQNAYDYFYIVVLNSISFSSRPEDIEQQAFKPQAISDIDRLLLVNGESVFLSFSRLFRHLFEEKKDENVGENPFETLLKNINSIENESTVFIQGNPGSGKSYFLYLFQKYLDKEGHNSYFINIHSYKQHNDPNSLQRFERDINVLLKQKKGHCLIIDGVDQFERFFVNKEVRLTHALWQKLRSCFDVIVLGITTQDYENDEDEDKQFYFMKKQ